MDSSRIVRTVRIVLSRFCSEGPAQNPQDTGTKEQPGTESFWFPSAPRAGPVPKYSIHKYLGERSVSQECWYAYEHRWDYDLCSEVPSWNPQDTRIKEHPRTGSFKFLSAPRINPLIYPKSQITPGIKTKKHSHNVYIFFKETKILNTMYICGWIIFTDGSPLCKWVIYSSILLLINITNK